MSTTLREAPAAATPAADRRTLHGLLAEFESPGALLDAAEKIRDAGYQKWDTHTPFPVHGIDAAMGITPTRLPFIVFTFGFLGCMLGLGLQMWTNASNARTAPGAPNFVSGYNFHVSGKPDASLPAFIPVTFELTVLLSAFAAVFGMLAMNNLPEHSSPLFATPRFKRATSDRFFVFVGAKDPRFQIEHTEGLLSGAGAAAIERVYDDGSPGKLPRVFSIAGMILVSLAFLPPMWIYKNRTGEKQQPRVHIIQDMDNQERFKAQQASFLFADGRAARPPVAGAVARQDWPRDSHYFEGKVDGEFAAAFPAQVVISEGFVRRGQERFNIYCAPCHGLDGGGNGIVNVRAQRLLTENWVQPTAMTDQLAVNRPHGHIFNTITHGIRSMPPYGDQIPVDDRWAIVAYVRALQYSQNAPVEEVPAELRPKKQ